MKLRKQFHYDSIKKNKYLGRNLTKEMLRPILQKVKIIFERN